MLAVRNLSISIGPFQAVQDLSFDIASGEITGLAGESGCGKTLTALSITGLLPDAAKVSSGEILFARNGGPPLNLRALSEEALCRIRGREISMIFQEPRQSLNPLIRAGAQIAETLELHGLADKKQAKAAAVETLAALGFEEPEKICAAFPHQLSGGMCQRVMIAMAAICRPKLLIADEPSTALDEAAQNQILSLLADINRSFGTAILFISHDLSVVRRFCGRFLVMYAGRIIEEGPAEKVFASPAHPYTRLLVGAIPDKSRRGKPLASIGGRMPSIADKLPPCPFAPRCPQRTERCMNEAPPFAEIGGGRRARCFFAGEHS
jgi:peptide/nickel transport system ATP-binding protein